MIFRPQKKFKINAEFNGKLYYAVLERVDILLK